MALAHQNRYNYIQTPPFTERDRPSSPPSLTHTSIGSSEHSDDAAARTLMTPLSSAPRERDYGGVFDPKGRAPLIPKYSESPAVPEPKTPTRSTWSKRDTITPASAPATPVEKRKSKRFTFTLGRDRGIPAPTEDEMPPLPSLDRLDAEREKDKRKSKRLSISRSLQNLHEKAKGDRARRRASTASKK